MQIKYSIVVPVYNEEQAIPLFYERIIPVMDKTKEEYEIIFVNDGSKDNTYNILVELANKDKRIKVIDFSRNFGQQAALLSGFSESKGEAVIDIDVDLQDRPEAILEMIEKWKEGYEVVHGRRTVREGETFFKKFTSTAYTKFIAPITGLNIPAKVGDFKLFDRKVINTICSLPEHNRFLRGITSWVGYKQAFVEFDRDKRAAGETKYTVKKLLKLAKDGIVANSDYPLSLPLKHGIFLSITSILCFLTFIVLLFFKIALPLTAWLFPTITLVASFLMIHTGLTNLYISRIYDEVKGRPNYIIREKINF